MDNPYFRKFFLGACACAALAVSASATATDPAGEGDVARPDDKLITEHYFPSMDLPADMQLETRLDADLNGDRLTDVAFIARNDDRRVLGVLLAFSEAMDMGHTPSGRAELGIDPLGPAGLTAPRGVLVVEDLTGGTTAISSTYRYRYEAKSKRMRLIGDDVKLYSRTNAHGWQEISTNRLTGLQIRRSADLDDAGEYVEQPETRGKVPTAPLYMEDAPAPETTLGWDQ